MSLDSSKNLAGAGAILIVVGAAAAIGGTLAGVGFLSVACGVIVLVGAILGLVGLGGLSKVYQEKGLYNNSLYSFIAVIAGVVVAVLALVYVVFFTSTLTNLLHELYPTWNGSWSTISSFVGTKADRSNLTRGTELAVAGALFGVNAVMWAFLVVASFFANRFLKSLAAKTGVTLFSTAALVLIIGALLSIIFIGYVIIWIAVVLLAWAFFQIQPKQEQPPQATPLPQPSTPTPV
ncbi:MAG: DUF996 domain-containing protein [Candidatus Bathyarchaeia archaeon]